MTQPTRSTPSPAPVRTVTAPPTPAFVGASWGALLVGVIAYLTGLYYADMELSDTGYYFTVLAFGLFASVSLQKAVRDRMEGVPVTSLYYGIAWAAVGTSLILLATGLWNATTLEPSEKGFYAMSFTLSLFAAVAVQKNVRDLDASKQQTLDVAPIRAEAPSHRSPEPRPERPVMPPKQP